MSVTLDRTVGAPVTPSSAGENGNLPGARPPGFVHWRETVLERGALPVIAVAGSRGKSTVVRLVEAIFREAGLTYASWTNAGVEIRGRRQRSELGAWGMALRRLAAGTLDVAIQELDWPTVYAVGLPAAAYPIAAVTNICINSDRCLVRAETKLAIRAYERVRSAARQDGLLVLNGDDYAVSGTEVERDTTALLIGLNPDAPILRAHLSDGERAAWLSGGWLTLGTATATEPICETSHLGFALTGAASFEIQNALIAAAIAHVCGIEVATIAAALASFQAPDPGSFNVMAVADATVVIDKPAPSWFMRTTMRALRHRPRRRLIVVAGALAEVPDDDLDEVGRLFGRISDAIILHSETGSAERAGALRTGIEATENPLLLVKQRTERQALTKAFKLLRPGDLLLIIADQPAAALRAVQRAGSIVPAGLLSDEDVSAFTLPSEVEE